MVGEGCKDYLSGEHQMGHEGQSAEKVGRFSET